MDKKMKIQIPIPVQTIIDKIYEAGYEAYAVGGCIRDSVTGALPNDWDICTNALPQTVEKIFSGFHIIETGLQHGTVTLMLNHIGYEITTYRTEGTYSDRRKPDYVNFVTDLREDVKRRDFTINAMAYNNENGLRDYFGGIDDLNNRIIRCVGDAHERFNEDALRILRAMRFAATFDFEIAPETASAMHRNKELLSYISKERISVELMKLLSGKAASRILREFSDILCEIIPEIKPCIGFEQNSPYHIMDVWEHTLCAIGHTNNSLIGLVMLLHDIGKPHSHIEKDGIDHFYGHEYESEKIARVVLKRLKMSNDIINTATVLIKYHDSLHGIDKKGIKRLLNKIGPENMSLLLDVAYADMMAHSEKIIPKTREELEFVKQALKTIEEENECYKVSDLEIGGKELIERGYCGREIGEKLSELLEAVIEGAVANKKSALLDYLEKHDDKKLEF